jgi:osmoprotectant transport system permease protein
VILTDLVAWFADPENWSGPDGVPARLAEHLQYTALALLLACLVAIPLGALVGHTGRGAFLVVGTTNALRALPTLGVVIMVVLLTGIGLGPVLFALVVLAVPPVMAGTYAGIRAVDPMVVDAARGVGMREREVLLQVEFPNALPLILGGIRSATLQLVSTATIAAFVAFGGLGRYIIDGLSVRDFAEVLAGAMLVAALAIVLDLALAGVERLVVSDGIRAPRGRART